MPKPDQSFYLAHFTKDATATDPQHNESECASALDRLASILRDRTIRANTIPWTKRPAVCFTECPWSSLLIHANNYSPYGLGFKKSKVYACGGNPVIYANPNLFDDQQWDSRVYPYVTPFVPIYAPEGMKSRAPFNGKAIDYSHEREWRTISDFHFDYQDVCFVILDKVGDLAKIPDDIREELGDDKFIFMDMYRKIEELWPVHRLE